MKLSRNRKNIGKLRQQDDRNGGAEEAQSEAQRWKSKFLDSLESREEKEKALLERISLLRRGLVRVSLAGDGLDPTLDEQLARLRDLLRSGESAEAGFGVLLEQIEKSVRRLDSNKADKASALRQALATNVSHLQSPPLGPQFSHGLRRRLRALGKDLDRSTGDRRSSADQVRDTQSRLLHAFLDLLPDAVAELSAAQAPRSPSSGPASKAPSTRPAPGLWTRLFGSSAASAPPTGLSTQDLHGTHALPGADKLSGANELPRAYQEPRADKEPRAHGLPPDETAAAPAQEFPEPGKPAGATVFDLEETSRRATTESTEVSAHTPVPAPGFSFIASHIEPLLLRLVDNIAMDETGSGEADAIRATVHQGLNWYEFAAVLEQISALVSGAFERAELRRNELQSFLNGINCNLEQIHNYLKLSRVQEDESSRSGQTLDRSVRDQLTELGRTLDRAGQTGQIGQRGSEADDLAGLKRAVQTRLNGIVSTMDSYRRDREKREALFARQTRQLEQRLSAMERESTRLREESQQQQSPALRDVLTQLPNRAAYRAEIADVYESWCQHSSPLCLAVGDVDHFKLINDNYGYLAGDKVLRALGRQMAACLRKTDFLARHGGEEFVMILPGLTLTEAEALVNEVRETVAECPFRFREKQVQITMSFGIATFADGSDTETVLSMAHEAMTQAKRDGRNSCVAIAPDRQYGEAQELHSDIVRAMDEEGGKDSPGDRHGDVNAAPSLERD